VWTAVHLAAQVGGQLGRGALLFGTLPQKPPVGPMKVPACRTLRLVLGDQLDRSHSWFDKVDPDTLYVIAELRQEATYVRHHVQKIVAFFAAMQAFARTLEGAGHRVLYLDLDTTAEYRDLPALLTALLAGSGADRFEYQRPDEYRLKRQLENFGQRSGLPCRCVESEHFLLAFGELPEWFPRGKKRLMEHFYRRMRRELGVLVDDQGQPEGGRWNYDRDNRARLPGDTPLPRPLNFDNLVGEFLERIRRHGIPVIGRMAGETLDWPVDRDQSLALLGHFIEHGLPDFGRYQDAMSGRDWLLFHSRLSFSMNTKMLSPREVVGAVLAAWGADPERYPLASVEGFIRQVIGWREYMRGIYWAYMPEYAGMNHFGHHRALPHYYWDGETGMACMAQAIGQSLEHAYAHHIQRLMVTGNFALLAGIDPDAVDAWYLGVYIDAIEWVEMPNARGMSQFADGGIVASKPYSASGNYIRKMGDYCQNCRYRVTERSGPDACPFNSLYWHFMLRNREELSANPRIGMLYRSWDRMDADQRDAILSTAEAHLENIERL
jgi:deoxyribodipyrimidine photolyase-related protein